MKVFQVVEPGGTVRTFHRSRCASDWWIKAHPDLREDDLSFMPTEVRLTEGPCLHCYWCGEKSFDGDGRGCTLCTTDDTCPNWSYARTIFGEETAQRLLEAFGGRIPDAAWSYALRTARHETTLPSEIVALTLKRRSVWEKSQED